MCLQDSMVVKGTCPDQSCIKQLRIYHARHQPSLSFPGSTNVGHDPNQGGPTLDGFGSCDLQVFAEAKPSIQLHSQVLKMAPEKTEALLVTDRRSFHYPIQDCENKTNLVCH